MWPVTERKNPECWTGTVNHLPWQEQSFLFLLPCLDSCQGLWWILQSSSQSSRECWSIYIDSGVQVVWSHLLVVLFVWFIFFYGWDFLYLKGLLKMFIVMGKKRIFIIFNNLFGSSFTKKSTPVWNYMWSTLESQKVATPPTLHPKVSGHSE